MNWLEGFHNKTEIAKLSFRSRVSSRSRTTPTIFPSRPDFLSKKFQIGIAIPFRDPLHTKRDDGRRYVTVTTDGMERNCDGMYVTDVPNGVLSVNGRNVEEKKKKRRRSMMACDDDDGTHYWCCSLVPSLRSLVLSCAPLCFLVTRPRALDLDLDLDLA